MLLTRFGREVAEDLRNPALAVPECVLNLTSQEEAMRESAQRAKGQIVFHVIDDDGYADALSIDTPDIVTVLPMGKWALKLPIAKVVVPGKLGDLRLPSNAHGEVWDWPEAKGDP